MYVDTGRTNVGLVTVFGTQSCAGLADEERTNEVDLPMNKRVDNGRLQEESTQSVVSANELEMSLPRESHGNHMAMGSCVGM